MKITVANISAKDRTQWAALYRSYAEFYKMPMSQETLRTVWSWIFDPGMKFYGLIARDSQGAAIGLMHCREMLSPLRGARVGFLDDLFLIPEARGSGAAEILYRELAAFARQQGWPFVRWITAENNYRGRGSYDKIADRTHWITYQLPVDLSQPLKKDQA